MVERFEDVGQGAVSEDADQLLPGVEGLLRLAVVDVSLDQAGVDADVVSLVVESHGLLELMDAAGIAPAVAPAPVEGVVEAEVVAVEIALGARLLLAHERLVPGGQRVEVRLGEVDPPAQRFEVRLPLRQGDGQLQEVAGRPGLIRGPEYFPAGLSGFPVVEDEFCVILPVGHPLARHKQITAAMLNDEDFVATPMEMEVNFWSNFAGSTSRRVVARASDVISVLTLVAGKVGISVLPAHVSNVHVPGIVFRRMSGVKRKASYSAVYRTGESAPLIKLFIKHLRSSRFSPR